MGPHKKISLFCQTPNFVLVVEEIVLREKTLNVSPVLTSFNVVYLHQFPNTIFILNLTICIFDIKFITQRRSVRLYISILTLVLHFVSGSVRRCSVYRNKA